MDITTAVVSAGSKALAGALTPGSKVGIARVGSREERRLAYLEYGQACTHFILSAGWVSAMTLADSKDSLKQASTVVRDRMAAANLMAMAHVAVRLSGTREVIAMADQLGDAARAVGEYTPGQGDEVYRAVNAAFVTAMNKYLELCRYELWYEPRWWQPHRLALRLWTTYWKERAARKEALALFKEARAKWETLSREDAAQRIREVAARATEA
ncbi:hypothetical protein [Kitasatospora griseola]|uniref:hypothetical protein n=1 Tax=Kitasatospora griseola TaxID=2064 RepID=UPI00166FCAA7|nr:hypothetical protein [Kitasatospora griseola]GGR00738.1 hypothetical protein GCM10010195_65680 [Kitasatospora griseola]